jgi:hypothetical protein
MEPGLLGEEAARKHAKTQGKYEAVKFVEIVSQPLES